MNSNNVNLNFRYFSFYIYNFYVESVLVILTVIRIFNDKILGLFNDAAWRLCTPKYNETQFSVPKILLFVTHFSLYEWCNFDYYWTSVSSHGQTRGLGKELSRCVLWQNPGNFYKYSRRPLQISLMLAGKQYRLEIYTSEIQG